MKFNFASLTAVAIFSVSAISAQAGVLDTVKARGELKCGVHPGKAGFAEPDDNGRWKGFDVSFCRAVAAAVLGDGDKVQFVPLSSKARFTALSSGEVDILARTTTGTATREASNGVDFTLATFYDGQGFLVTKAIGVKSALELDGASICVSPGTTSEQNLNDYFIANGMTYKVVVIEKAAEIIKAYESGRCDAITNDRSGLAARRIGLKDPSQHTLLPEIISKEPLGPFVSQGDAQWRDIVEWVAHGLIIAEELGVTQANANTMAKSSTNPNIKRLLGTDKAIGEAFGLDNAWMLRAIEVSGNYGEIFTTNLGSGTRMNLDRGLNNLWSNGGIVYGYPFR
jgi:general L-amino acid transport system substrate-binding protein